ncbi:hypothetical protein AMTR_s00035p00011390, partial [Amborella trichopoda]
PEALIVINLIPSLADILFETVRENKAFRLQNTELLTALDAVRATSERAERELLEVRNVTHALSREYDLVVDENVQLSIKLAAYCNELLGHLPPLDLHMEDIQPF